MRKITKDAISAFNINKNFKRENTQVKVLNGVTILLLHDNPIAFKSQDGISITNAGWFSSTTKERLNGISGVNIKQRNFVWYLNDNKWDGRLVNVI